MVKGLRGDLDGRDCSRAGQLTPAVEPCRPRPQSVLAEHHHRVFGRDPGPIFTLDDLDLLPDTYLALCGRHPHYVATTARRMASMAATCTTR
jgi:hypothetical protein